VTKYTIEDVRKQKSSIEKFYQWEMVKNKDIKTQINKYHRLLEDMKAKNINLLEGFIAGILIKKNYPTNGMTTSNNSSTNMDNYF
jgi:hypothetical protein